MNSRRDTSNRWASALLALAIYQALAILWFGTPLLGDFSRSYIGIKGSSDPAGYMWFLTWWPYALFHRLNPFITKLAWAPSGFNVTWAHCVPLPALVAAPITHFWGPVVTWNILCLIAPALAAWCAFILCRHLCGSFLPSFIGGYMFGFSPYMLGHLLGHLSLIEIFPVPLAVLLFVIALEGRLSQAGFVLALTLLILIQFLCCHELVGGAVVLGGAVIVAAIVLTDAQVRAKALELSGLALIALMLSAAALSPFLYYAFFHAFPHGAINPPEVHSSDLLAFFIPTPTLLIGEPAVIAAIANRMTGGFAEDTAYVGIPLIALVIDFAIANWRDARARVMLAALGITTLASLGPRLHIGSRATVLLPWAIMERLPLLEKALPGRFMLFAFLDLGLITAVYLTVAPRRRKWFLTLLALVCLMPNLARGWWWSIADTPRFFTSGIFRRYLARGEITLVLPFGSNGNSMLWQAETGMYYRMAGGFLGLTPASFSRWPLVAGLTNGDPCFDFARQLKFFAAAHDVRTIIVAGDARRTWSALFASAGIAPVQASDALLYPVPPQWRRAYAGVTAHDAAMDAAKSAFAAMAIASNAYWERGLPLAQLTPWSTARLRLLALPAIMAGPNPGAPQWWQNLWLGAQSDASVAIGVRGNYEDLRGVIAAYAPLATTVLFPYPVQLRPGLAYETDGLLLMTFDRSGLARAANLSAMPQTR